MDLRRRPLLLGLVSGTVGLVAAVGAAAGVDALTGDGGGEPEVELRFTPDQNEVPGPDLGDQPGAGALVPSTPFELLGGGLTSLRDYRGRPVVLNFFSSTCVPCRKEMPALQSASEELGDRVRFVGLAVNDSARAANQLVDETGVTYDTGRDPAGKLFQELEVVLMPSTFLVDAEGRVVSVHPGALDRDEIVELVEDHLL
jgi:thiol-disulfide isomerase/thioredoxin